VGYWIYTVQTPGHSFWTWPGWLALLVTLFGLMLLLFGLARPSGSMDQPVRQKQRGGKKSRNLQAGRDININSDPDKPAE
jgi:hypothetical protein